MHINFSKKLYRGKNSPIITLGTKIIPTSSLECSEKSFFCLTHGSQFHLTGSIVAYVFFNLFF